MYPNKICFILIKTLQKSNECFHKMGKIRVGCTYLETEAEHKDMRHRHCIHWWLPGAPNIAWHCPTLVLPHWCPSSDTHCGHVNPSSTGHQAPVHHSPPAGPWCWQHGHHTTSYNTIWRLRQHWALWDCVWFISHHNLAPTITSPAQLWPQQIMWDMSTKL